MARADHRAHSTNRHLEHDAGWITIEIAGVLAASFGYLFLVEKGAVIRIVKSLKRSSSARRQ